MICSPHSPRDRLWYGRPGKVVPHAQNHTASVWRTPRFDIAKGIVPLHGQGDGQKGAPSASMPAIHTPLSVYIPLHQPEYMRAIIEIPDTRQWRVLVELRGWGCGMLTVRQE